MAHRADAAHGHVFAIEAAPSSDDWGAPSTRIVMLSTTALALVLQQAMPPDESFNDCAAMGPGKRRIRTTQATQRQGRVPSESCILCPASLLAESIPLPSGYVFAFSQTAGGE